VCYLPSYPLSDQELKYYVKAANIKKFRGVFMRDTLPSHPRTFEKIILNLDSNDGSGTHWVCFTKHRDIVQYYDSFGNLPPPKELINYLKDCKIYFNRECEQEENTVICGHLCILFLCG
jgi:hypothetical protein